MSLTPAFNYLMLVRCWTRPKNRIQNSVWKIMQETSGLAVVVFRDRISHAPCTEIEVAPGNRFLLEQLLETVHTPYGGILWILNDKMASMLNLMQSYLCTESHHREIFLPIFMAFLLTFSGAPHTPWRTLGCHVYDFWLLF